MVELDASSLASGSAIKLTAGSDGTTVRSLVIHGAPAAGAKISSSDGNTIADNYLGTEATGDAITATSTNPGGSTSEFSTCVDAVAVQIELFSDSFESGDTTAWDS